MNSDEERLNWEIDTVRRAISIDLARLASKKLTPEKREIIREHLFIRLAAQYKLPAIYSNRFSVAEGALSTPETSYIGAPERKYINDACKKAPELGVFLSGVRLGLDYPPAYPGWHGVIDACFD